MTFLDNLNDKQLEAATYDKGPLLILAGAGTGKTKVLTSRIIHLINTHKAYPGQILSVTFTNKAAKEMVSRVSKYVRTDGSWLGTFHAIAARILRSHSEKFGLSNNFTILGIDDQMRVIKSIIKANNIDEKTYPAKIILSIIQRWKDLAINYENISNADLKSPAHHIAKAVYQSYTNRLKYLDAVDFGDLLLLNIKLFSQHKEILESYHNRFKYILVDEYQDTNIAQYIWLRLLVNKERNICCVGDEDQSIYGWRGAEIANILKFEKDFSDAKIVRLEQNYRSTNNILSAASGLISNNNERLGKNLWSDTEGGEKIKIVTLWDDNEEAKYVAKTIQQMQLDNSTLESVAVLVRAGFQTRSIEESLISYSIPYKIIGGLKFYERQEIKDILAYIRATINPSDSIALERIINTPKRGIGPATVSTISKYAQSNNISLQVAISEMISQDLLKPKIKKELFELISNIKVWREDFSCLEINVVLEKILHESGYMQMWKDDTSIESHGKIENIKELCIAIKEFSDINDFIEHVSLVTDNDNNNNDNVVNVMTIHAAKGLEFDTIISPGWEEGIFPHQKSLEESGTKGLEEERRLAYVAITRAKYNMYITQTISRKTFGQWQTCVPSRFLSELPEDNILRFEHNYNISTTNQLKHSQTTKTLSKFNIGNRVKHKKFGFGYILNIIDNQIEISFDQFGTKMLLESYIEKV